MTSYNEERKIIISSVVDRIETIKLMRDSATPIKQNYLDIILILHYDGKWLIPGHTIHYIHPLSFIVIALVLLKY